MGKERTSGILTGSAHNLYWLGRYLERARHQSRALQLQMEGLTDRSVRGVYFSWRRLYNSMSRQPPVENWDTVDYSDEDFALTDAYVLAEDMTFEQQNPSSLWSCINASRENARHARNNISSEMWEHLNRLYLQLKSVDMTSFWQPIPERFYADITRELDAFTGIANVSMYHSEHWSFLQIGRYIERSQLMSSVLLAQLQLTGVEELPSQEIMAGDWLSLLRIYHAFDIYKWKYSTNIKPDLVFELLCHDINLSYSLTHNTSQLHKEIAKFPPAFDQETANALTRLCACLLLNSPTFTQEKFLLLHGDLCRLHELFIKAYIDYEINRDIPYT